MDSKKVKIVNEGIVTRIFIDDIEIKDITNFELTQDAGKFPKLKLFMKYVDIEFEGEVNIKNEDQIIDQGYKTN